MNKFVQFFALALAAAAFRPGHAAPLVLREAARVAETIYEKVSTNVCFELDGRVTFVSSRSDDPDNDTDSRFVSIGVEDGSGAIIIYDYASRPGDAIAVGDHIHATGTTAMRIGNLRACCREIHVLSSGPPPVPRTISAREFLSGRHEFRLVRLDGVIRDAFRDEIDPRWIYLILHSDGETVYVVFTDQSSSDAVIESLVGTTVSITGICDRSAEGARRQLGHILMTDGMSAIDTRNTPESNAHDVQPLGEIAKINASEIFSLGRRLVSGRVLAVCQRNRIILRTASGYIVNVDLAKGKPPTCGAEIDAAGLPMTDLFRVNLIRATWHPANRKTEAWSEQPEDISVARLMVNSHGRKRIDTSYHGRLVRIAGEVVNLSDETSARGTFYLKEGLYTVAIDASSDPTVLQGLRNGCQIRAIGICAVETENWRPNTLFPRVKGVSFVLRSASDLTVVEWPPWWTTRRLMLLIGTLLAALAFVMGWNVLLRRRVERRSQELLAETIVRIESQLKVYERTRLAVEIHDSIAQNLTGVALEISAAERYADDNLEQMRHHLGMAATTLRSCRQELRNCLWDLRNNVLEECEMDEAIRKTLAPYLNGARLLVRFNVPRARIADTTAHAILRIARELTLNAIRHGGARTVRVAGGIDGDRLKFSVTDDGTGFDPAVCPGVESGHYGLQGIRERIESFEGDMTIDARPGHGVKVVISLSLPRDTEGIQQQ